MNNKDIIYYDNLLKENILLVEEDKSNEEALKLVEENFKEVYELIKLYLINYKDRYYGYFILNLKLRIDFRKDIIAGVSVDDNPFILLTNPLLLGKYKIKEMVFIICHELEHLVLNHPAESVRINPSKNHSTHVLLNYAQDASINDVLMYENRDIYDVPKDLVTSKVISEIVKQNLRACEDYLYYYQYLEKLNNKMNNNLGLFLINKNGNEIITSKDSNGKNISPISKEDDSNNISEQIKDFVKEVVDGIPDKYRGLMPVYQQENINKLLAPPKIKWQSVLKRYIGLTPIPYKKTKTRLNRRQPNRFDISGRINDRTIRIVVALDTSGSMSNKMIEYIFVEIFEILKKSKFELTIIECDAEIGKVYKAKNINDINMKVTGRGGTSYLPVIEYINENNFRDALLIYFTDGFGDYEIPKPRTYRNLWVVFDNTKNLSLKNPYGEVIELYSNEI